MLTPAQAVVFKTAIDGNALLVAERAAQAHGLIAAHYNAAGTGFIWRPRIAVEELNTAIVWADFVALTAIKQNGYIAMTQGGSINATDPEIRAGFAAIFGGASATVTNLTALAQRVPTRFEVLFTTANVSSMFGRIASNEDVAQAMGL